MTIEGLRNLRNLVERFYEWNVKEWTIECNPETLTRPRLEAMREIGINRLSLGVQTFNPKQLRRLERLATYEHIEKILVDVQNLFTNFSVDLMIGIPDQTLDGLNEDLERISKLRPPHLSVYLLTLDANHKLKTKVSIAPRIANDELASEMYLKVCESLERLGYDHYEVSNFAQPGFQSQHNSNYWNPARGYLGLGPGAHGYLCLKDRRVRYENFKDVSNWATHQIGFNETETLTADQIRIEDLYLRLRTRKPVMVHEVDEAFAVTVSKTGLLQISNDTIKMTRRGWLVIESLAARLIS